MKQILTQLTCLSKKTLIVFAILIGTAVSSNAQPGNALNFDGTNDYVIIGPAGGVYAIGSSYTKEAWVLYGGPVGAGVHNIISSKDAFWVEGGVLHAGNNFDGNTPDLNDATPFTQNHWEFVALTYDLATTTLKLYRNGVLVATTATALASTSGQNYIGAYDDAVIGGLGLGTNTYSWNGSIDQVRVYNTALTQANIQADMVSTTASVPGNLQAYYNFNTGTAGGTNTGLTTLTDNSGNGNNGTLNNFALAGATSNWIESYSLLVPTATAATNVSTGLTGFTAHWTPPTATGTIDNYLLYVSSTADFTTPIAGSPFTVPFGTNSYAVTGLTASTNYYYRVSADKASVTTQGAFSNTISALALLPVNLVSFNVSKVTGANQLQWSTASEQSSKFFELLRSEDGANFTSIAKINSSGSSSTTKAYQYNDNLSSSPAPVYYYRLRLVDINGNFSYSNIILIKNTKGTTITVYPNPAQDRLIVNITDKSLLNTIASLSDISGKLLQKVLITQTATPINISTYTKGVYVLRLANGQSIKLIKD